MSRFSYSKKETRTQTKKQKKPKPIDHIEKCGLISQVKTKTEKN
jgi:hypothetical protein